MLGALILTLLCLLTPDIWRSEALLVAGALQGGVLVYLVTLQIPLTTNVRTVLLALLWGGMRHRMSGVCLSVLALAGR